MRNALNPGSRPRRSVSISGVLSVNPLLTAWERTALLPLVVQLLGEMEKNGAKTPAA